MMDVEVELEVDAKSKPWPWTTRSLVQNLSDSKSNSWYRLNRGSSWILTVVENKRVDKEIFKFNPCEPS